jgi:hypothetical protein
MYKTIFFDMGIVAALALAAAAAATVIINPLAAYADSWPKTSTYSAESEFSSSFAQVTCDRPQSCKEAGGANPNQQAKSTCQEFADDNIFLAGEKCKKVKE